LSEKPYPKPRRPENASNRPNMTPGRTMRARFSRTDATSWLAHLDLMRVFERTLRRTGLPLAFTQGFSPHPVMTFALPLGVGIDAADDVADFALDADIAPEEFVVKMNATLPEGLRILGARIAPEGGESLMAAVHEATYVLRGPGIGAALARLPAAGPLPVQKKGKEGSKTVDVRPLLVELTARDDDSLEALVKAGSRENLRPDLLLQALVDHAGLPQDVADDAATLRTALYTAGPDGVRVRLA
jgi:radical SAM-linked protein